MSYSLGADAQQVLLVHHVKLTGPMAHIGKASQGQSIGAALDKAVPLPLRGVAVQGWDPDYELQLVDVLFEAPTITHPLPSAEQLADILAADEEFGKEMPGAVVQDGEWGSLQGPKEAVDVWLSGSPKVRWGTAGDPQGEILDPSPSPTPPIDSPDVIQQGVGSDLLAAGAVVAVVGILAAFAWRTK